jgi:hypothetical protein
MLQLDHPSLSRADVAVKRSQHVCSYIKTDHIVQFESCSWLFDSAGTLAHYRAWAAQVQARYQMFNAEAARPARRIYVGGLPAGTQEVAPSMACMQVFVVCLLDLCAVLVVLGQCPGSSLIPGLCSLHWRFSAQHHVLPQHRGAAEHVLMAWSAAGAAAIHQRSAHQDGRRSGSRLSHQLLQAVSGKRDFAFPFYKMASVSKASCSHG